MISLHSPHSRTCAPSHLHTFTTTRHISVNDVFLQCSPGYQNPENTRKFNDGTGELGILHIPLSHLPVVHSAFKLNEDRSISLQAVWPHIRDATGLFYACRFTTRTDQQNLRPFTSERRRTAPSHRQADRLNRQSTSRGGWQPPPTFRDNREADLVTYVAISGMSPSITSVTMSPQDRGRVSRVLHQLRAYCQGLWRLYGVN